MLFVIYCLDKPGHDEVRLANRAAHIEYARRNADKMLVGGPLLSDDGQRMIGSMLVIDLPDRGAADALMAKDPYVTAGLFDSIVIRPYKKVLP